MLAYLFVIFAVAIRFLPHPWSFTPVAAALLFFGARGSRRQVWIPVALLAASDLALNRYVYAYPFGWDQVVTCLWYAAIVWLGTRLRDHAKPLPIIGAALASSVSFFLISNFGVWAAGTMYPKNFGGLITCYTLALPFFRQGVEGDLLFTVAMFATPVALYALTRFLRTANRTAAV